MSPISVHAYARYCSALGVLHFALDDAFSWVCMQSDINLQRQNMRMSVHATSSYKVLIGSSATRVST